MKLILLILFFWSSVSIQAQKIQHILSSEAATAEVEWFSFCQADSCNIKFQELLNQLHEQGFLEASLDSLISKKDTLKIAYWYLGNKYQWLELNEGNIPKSVIDKAGVRIKNFKNFSFAAIKQAQKQILKVYENEGYPFANIRLTNVAIVDNQKISAEWFLDKQRFVSIDSLTVKGTANINSRFLSNYLEIEKGDAYNEQQLKNISRRIAELSFLKEIRPPQIEFQGETAKVRTFLDKQQASRFDFVLGVLPQSNNEGGVKITGDGLIELVNPFGMGEQLKVKYSGYPGKSRELESRVQYPYLPFLPVGIDAKFNLYLQDTIFRTSDAYFGVRYNLGGNNFVQFYYQNQATALLGFNEAQLRSSLELPDILDINKNFYGFEYQWQKLDYRLNPLKGWDVKINTALGTKKIRLNARILSLEDPDDENFSFGQLYDSLSLNNLQIKTEFQLAKYWKLGQLTTLLTRWRGAVLRNINTNKTTKQTIIHENEQYRIGGNQLLRGFDEQSIQADLYNILTFEFRYLLSRNSNAFIFADIGNRYNLLLENKDFQVDYPYGFGIGVNFETKAGVFGLSYALGTQLGNNIELRTAKIHFGYQNYF